MNKSADSLDHLRQRLCQFTKDRDWGQFHTPKNLATALSVEVAELLEPFQWLSSGNLHELDQQTREAVRHEMADVLCYLVLLADSLEVDLIAAAEEKIALNAKKYPADLVRGDSRKYTKYKNTGHKNAEHKSAG